MYVFKLNNLLLGLMLSGGKFASLSSSEPTTKPPNHSPGDGILGSAEGTDSDGRRPEREGGGALRVHTADARMLLCSRTRTEAQVCSGPRGRRTTRLPSSGVCTKGAFRSLRERLIVVTHPVYFRTQTSRAKVFSSQEQMFSPSETQVQVSDPEERKGGCAS